MQCEAETQRVKGGWQGLVALTFAVNILNYLDRQVPFILLEEIKRDLSLSDVGMGLVSGLTFTLVYSLASIPLANLADRWSSKWVLTMSVAIWCGLTVMSGQARTIGQFAAARIGVAMGEAGCTPTSHALISRFVPRNRRAMAIAIFSLGIPLGGMLGLIAGGWLGDRVGWRMTMLLVGAPGVLLVIAIILMVPDSRRLTQSKRSGLSRAALRALFERRTMGWIVASVSVQGIAQYAVYSFSAAFLIRSYGIGMSEAGLGLGIANGVSGVAGLIVGGWIATVDNRRGLVLAAVAFMTSAPIIWLACTTDTYLVALLLLALFNFCAIFYMPSTFATVQALAPEGQNAIASSVVVVGVGLVGGSLGPILAGALSDFFTPIYGTDAMKVALSFSAIPVLAAGAMMLVASRRVEADLALRAAC